MWNVPLTLSVEKYSARLNLSVASAQLRIKSKVNFHGLAQSFSLVLIKSLAPNERASSSLLGE